MFLILIITCWYVSGSSYTFGPLLKEVSLFFDAVWMLGIEVQVISGECLFMICRCLEPILWELLIDPGRQLICFLFYWELYGRSYWITWSSSVCISSWWAIHFEGVMSMTKPHDWFLWWHFYHNFPKVFHVYVCHYWR